jgi:hypothetical protein
MHSQHLLAFSLADALHNINEIDNPVVEAMVCESLLAILRDNPDDPDIQFISAYVVKDSLSVAQTE